MNCACTTYQCLETVINLDPCANVIEMKLQSNETGSWIYSYEFNNRWFGGSIDVVSGENIVLPFTFNENYVHALKFYNMAGELVNNTCYTLNTANIVGAYINSDMPQENIFNITITTAGSTFSSSKINGRQVMVVFDGNQAYNRQANNFTQVGNTGTMTDVTFYAGQIITVTVAH